MGMLLAQSKPVFKAKPGKPSYKVVGEKQTPRMCGSALFITLSPVPWLLPGSCSRAEV